MLTTIPPRARAARVAVLDRNPAVRAGVPLLLRRRPGLLGVGAAADEESLWPLLYRARPDVLLVGHHPGSGANLATCLRVTCRPMAPHVVVWAAEMGTDTLVPAVLAGAGALVDAAADERELLHAIDAVARGEQVLPRLTPAVQATASARLGPADRAIVAMRLHGTSVADCARVVGLTPGALESRLAGIVARLGTRGAVAAADGNTAHPAAGAIGGAA
jgi:DNA-binding NarL/FixJ family response regulator